MKDLKHQLYKLCQSYKKSSFSYFYKESIAVADSLIKELEGDFNKEELLSFYLSEFKRSKDKVAILVKLAEMLMEHYKIDDAELDQLTDDTDFAFSLNERDLGVFLYFHRPQELQELPTSPAMSRRI